MYLILHLILAASLDTQALALKAPTPRGLLRCGAPRNASTPHARLRCQVPGAAAASRVRPPSRLPCINVDDRGLPQPETMHYALTPRMYLLLRAL